MSSNTILFIALATISALGLVYFSYFFKTNRRGRSTWVLAGLRFISIFLLLLLLVNPVIKRQEYETQKPVLNLVVDQSMSVKYLGKEDSVRGFVNTILKNSDLQKKFKVNTYGFGENLKTPDPDSIHFSEQQTDISRALEISSNLHSGTHHALVLITDGNQTMGEDYEYFTGNPNTVIQPVVLGDTTVYADLFVDRLNVNKYAFLNNRFPVETIINYSGKIPVQSRFEIRSGNAVLYSELLSFDSEQNSKVITTSLPAGNLGTQFYEVSIAGMPSEKNTINNRKKFAVEIVDERSSVLILTSISHPDLGALKKAIESNEQRQANIINIEDIKSAELEEYQLVILYQPDQKFREVIDVLQNKNQNFFLISGTNTDWNLLNSVQKDFKKEISSLDQDVFAVYNENFSGFQFENIGFSKFPPLSTNFGKITFENKAYNTLLFQLIEGVPSDLPLLLTYEAPGRRYMVLFGENIWKWRMQSFVDTKSFEAFDTFFGKLIQYLSSGQKRDRLTFDVEPFYYSNEGVIISAQFFDQNYAFDPGGRLLMRIRKAEGGEEIQAQLLPAGNYFKAELTGLAAGEYVFDLREETTGISRSGNFSVLELNVEEQFVSANAAKLKILAENSSGELYFLSDQEKLIQDLLGDNRFMSIQKSREKVVPFSDWKILLVLLVLSLGSEWFIRKYEGLI